MSDPLQQAFEFRLINIRKVRVVATIAQVLLYVAFGEIKFHVRDIALRILLHDIDRIDKSFIQG